MVKRRLANALSILTLVLGAAGCGAGVQRVQTTTDIAITIRPTQDELPFDPRSARLRSATDQLTQLAGHPIAIQIDAALVPAFRADFERALIGAVEQMARGLADWKEAEPERFERSARVLRRVECRYRATATEPSATLDEAAGVMRIDLGAHPESLVPRGIFLDAMISEDEVFHERLFGSKTPDTVAPGERRAYFDTLTERTRSYGTPWRRRAAEKKDAGAVTLSILRLHALTRGTDPELAARARAWLMGRLPVVSRSRSSADDAFVRWLVAELPRATSAERLAVARSVFAREARDTYAGLDRFAFGLSIVDQWIRAGHPDPSPSKDPTLTLYDEIVCPPLKVARGEYTRSRGCTSTTNGWLQFVTEDEAGREKLARALDQRDDPALAAAIFFGLRSRSPRRSDADPKADPFLAVLHQLDPKRASWSEAIDLLATDRDRALEQEGAYLWKAYPAQRGDALFLIAQSKRDLHVVYGDAYWQKFSRSYGAAVDAATLRAMLARGPRAFELVPQLWPALAPGFSRADVLLPSLDALLPGAVAPLSEIVSRLCKDANAADLGKLHAYVAKRPEAVEFAVLKRDTAPGGCRGR